MAIDLRALRYFSSIAASGSISRSAELLHVAQPALSLRIRKMEEALGVDLLVRTSRGVSLTAAGKRLLAHADDILGRVEAAFADVRASAAEPAGTVALGMPQSIAKVLAVPMVEATLKRWPGIGLKIIELNTGYIPEFLAAGRIDIGMMFFEAESPRLSYRALVEEELVLVGPKGCFGSDALPMRLTDTADLPLILPMPMHSLRQLIDTIVARTGVTLNVISEVNAIPQLLDLAEAGVGYTILSRGAVREAVAQARVAIVPIIEPGFVRPVFLCRAAGATPGPAVSSIEALIVETSARLVGDGSWPAKLA